MTVHYPPQTDFYKVNVQHSRSTHSWTAFNSARFQLSIGQKYHEGLKFQSHISWAAPRFKKTLIMVNDTLQRYGLMFSENISEEEAYNITKKYGNRWLDDHGDIIDTHPNAVTYRWDFWIQHPDFPERLQSIKGLYKTNSLFKNALDKDITNIWNRRVSQNHSLYTPEKFDHFHHISCMYLFEELAAYSIMFDQEKAIDIYPGSLPEVLNLFMTQTIEGAPQSLSTRAFCRIEFGRNKNYKPQFDTNTVNDIRLTA